MKQRKANRNTTGDFYFTCKSVCEVGKLKHEDGRTDGRMNERD